VSFYRESGKRFIDIIASLLGMIWLAPIFLFSSAAIWLEDRRMVLFRQVRIGKNGKTFVLYKFRSMPIGTPDMPSVAAACLKLTRVGRLLRRTNIDELPQLMNVLRGEMSFVGPRPALVSQYDVIELRKKNGAYHIKPGLTGLAQVNSYNGMAPEEKAEWDGLYSKDISFSADLKIVMRTLEYLLKPPPVY
jgi:O-antigen biosynthesis protein WbqP